MKIFVGYLLTDKYYNPQKLKVMKFSPIRYPITWASIIPIWFNSLIFLVT